ncbi:MAG: RepB family plasmid replication initiator protein [Bacteroidales bacterium]
MPVKLSKHAGKIKLRISFQDSFEQSNMMSTCRKNLPENAWTLHKYILRKICFMPSRDELMHDCINNKKEFSITIPSHEIKDQFGHIDRYYRIIKSSLGVLNTALVQWERPVNPAEPKGKEGSNVKLETTTLVSSSEYSDRDGLNITISNKMLALYTIGDNFTIMDMAICSTLGSRGAQFLYEKLCQYRNCISFSYTPDDFKEDYGSKSYSNHKMKSLVIIPAIAELKSVSEEYLDFEEVKGGKGDAIKEWKFILKYKDIVKQQRMTDTLVNEILDICSPYIDLIQRSNLRRQTGPEEWRIQDIYNKVILFKSQVDKGGVKNPTAYLYTCLKDIGVDIHLSEGKEKAKRKKALKTEHIEPGTYLPVKKKRGRPRKNPLPVEDNQSTLSFEATPDSDAMVDMTQWNVFQDKMLSLLDAEIYNIWINPIEPISYINNTLTVQVPSRFVYETIESQYINEIGIAIREAFGPETQLNYVLKN